MEFDLDLQGALQAMTERVTGWVEGFIASLPNFVAALLVLVLAWVVARVVRNVVANLLARVSEYRAVNRLLSTLAFGTIVIVGLFVALGILELSKTVTSLLAGAGIVGLAIGFAAQDTLENLLSGIMISVRRPFREGDLIETNDVFGTVRQINLRATVVRTGSGPFVYIPNSEVYKNPMTNFTQPGRRRVDLVCGVAYGDDLEEAGRVALAAVEGVDARDPDREPELYWEEFGGSSINFVLRFWIPFTASQAAYLAARSQAIVRLKRAFDEHGITIPFPIRTLDFGVVGGTPLSEELTAVPGRGAT